MTCRPFPSSEHHRSERINSRRRGGLSFPYHSYACRLTWMQSVADVRLWSPQVEDSVHLAMG